MRKQLRSFEKSCLLLVNTIYILLLQIKVRQIRITVMPTSNDLSILELHNDHKWCLMQLFSIRVRIALNQFDHDSIVTFSNILNIILPTLYCIGLIHFSLEVGA